MDTWNTCYLCHVSLATMTFVINCYLFCKCNWKAFLHTKVCHRGFYNLHNIWCLCSDSPGMDCCLICAVGSLVQKALLQGVHSQVYRWGMLSLSEHVLTCMFATAVCDKNMIYITHHVRYPSWINWIKRYGCEICKKKKTLKVLKGSISYLNVESYMQ